jgi:hypothetical protein
MVELGSGLALLFVGLVVYVIIVHFIFFLRRYGWLPGGRPAHHGLGNAYLGLQSLAEPEKRYILEERLKEEKEEDYEGGPDDPTAHLGNRKTQQSASR